MPETENQDETPSTTNLNDIRDLLESKFSRLEVRINSLDHRISNLEDKLTENQEELKKVIQEVDVKAQNALDLCKANAILISDNTETIEGKGHELEMLKEKVNQQQEALISLQEELEDTRNRGMRKTLIFRGIKQGGKNEAWDESKRKLAAEIKKVMPDIEVDTISSKIERAHRGKESVGENNSKSEQLPIIAKFTDWTFSEQVKTAFIKASKSSNSRPIFVSQMYTKALTSRRNNAMKRRMELKKENKNVQGYVKYPAILMIKYPNEARYTAYEEF